MGKLPDLQKMIRERRESIGKEKKRREKIIEKIQRPLEEEKNKKCALCKHYKKKTEQYGYCTKHEKRVPAQYLCEDFEYR
ncbi:MAG: hypothetical protein U9N35_03555 [Euryarchaeota archaeon]|nr:hypothetical protein [Euryarchaeota archaeon]